jgi:hypothetical protein
MTERYDTGNGYRVPDTIAGLVDDLQQRDYQRKRAIDIARARAEAAENQDDLLMFWGLAGDMVEVRQEYRGSFPELFPEEFAG